MSGSGTFRGGVDPAINGWGDGKRNRIGRAETRSIRRVAFVNFGANCTLDRQMPRGRYCDRVSISMAPVQRLLEHDWGVRWPRCNKLRTGSKSLGCPSTPSYLPTIASMT